MQPKEKAAKAIESAALPGLLAQDERVLIGEFGYGGMEDLAKMARALNACGITLEIEAVGSGGIVAAFGVVRNDTVTRVIQ